MWHYTSSKSQAEELARAAVYAVHRKGIFDTSDLIDRADEIIPETLRGRLGDDCILDLKQAGPCLAFELPTAAGFHMMRATESSMWAYWEHLEKTKRPRNSNWGNAIQDLEQHSGSDPKVVAALKQLKDLHRNPVVHPEVVLTMDEALSLWAVAPGVIIAVALHLP